mmetsp:Transcript_12058/g.19635  ORF Transcript_12058/g.19635 Transcript_12058/m.19635 type:complete len:416 (+) Transcript_12058:239-1486(+)|eukprot:CAMPEP_0203775844 /NCGR_PEP_ID=MMETSP0099_2-20121227/6371_1 /ASSEMBLY_ACC=CAM_ASM_000209 /TAXON_ID=96639 /ORGANISM=" , Strain NY0313808BC1" /LENGTH=415 /DNA_ID=CAMNT_0050674695 /DNA_START=164 /DNA_END=1411 /DNA_ORIENTATION=+
MCGVKFILFLSVVGALVSACDGAFMSARITSQGHSSLLSEEYLDDLAKTQADAYKGKRTYKVKTKDFRQVLVTVAAKIANQTFDLCIDTGSSNTWVYGEECMTCPNPRFSWKNLTDYVPAEDSAVSVTFGSGAMTAHMGKTTFSIQNITLHNQTVLVADSVSGSTFHESGMQGLLGLGFRSLAANQHTTVFDSICENKLLNVNQFFFLMANPKEQYFVMGEPSNIEDAFIGPTLTLDVVDPYYWETKVDDILYDGRSIFENEAVARSSCKMKDGKRDCRIIFDSGTTVNTMPGASHAQFVRLVREGGKCENSLKNVTYILGGRNFTFSPSEHSRRRATSSCPTMLMDTLDVTGEHGPAFLAGKMFLEKFLVLHRRDGTCDDSKSTVIIGKANPNYQVPDDPPSLRESLVELIRPA